MRVVPRSGITAIVVRIICHRSVAFACMFTNSQGRIAPQDDIAVTAEPDIHNVVKCCLSSRQRSDIGYLCFVAVAQRNECRTSSINLRLALCGENHRIWNLVNQIHYSLISRSGRSGRDVECETGTNIVIAILIVIKPTAVLESVAPCIKAKARR